MTHFPKLNTCGGVGVSWLFALKKSKMSLLLVADVIHVNFSPIT